MAATHLAQQPDDECEGGADKEGISRHKDAQGEKEGSKELGQESEIVKHFYMTLRLLSCS